MPPIICSCRLSPILQQAFFCIALMLVHFNARAEATIPMASAEDNIKLILQIEQDVLALQQLSNRTLKRPEVEVLGQKEPRHVYQKALEVLAKVNRYRQIKNLGPIVTPLYPTRDITLNDVHTLILHLQGEIKLLLPEHLRTTQPVQSFTQVVNSTDVYRQIWRVSLALDPVLGVRGFTPSDVYQQAEYIVDLVKFLRRSQNLNTGIEMPKLTKGKHPNHALKAAYDLQTKIYQTQKNLWVTAPAMAPTVPKRVITPTDVYDALQVNIAELQRVKYRLGIEYEQQMPTLKRNKTPDDVIQMLTWARLLMPSFQIDSPLYQYPKSSLAKNNLDIYQVVHRLNNQLSALQKARGVRQQTILAAPKTEVNLRHVLQISLQNLRKINLLRKKMGQLTANIPHPPLHQVSATEVYELALRLESEFNNYFAQIDFKPQSVPSILPTTEISARTLYLELQNIAQALDLLVGENGFNLHLLYQEARDIRGELYDIYQQLGRVPSEFSLISTDLDSGQDNAALLAQTLNLLQSMQKIHSRAGTFLLPPPSANNLTTANLSNLSTNLNLLYEELLALKPYLGMFSVSDRPLVSQKSISRATLVHELAYIARLLDELLKLEAE